MIGALRENWRIALLGVFVAFALVALFVPGGVFADDSYAGAEDESFRESPTNLEYGLGLDGGTRVSAPVVGMTVEDVDLGVDPTTDDPQVVADREDEVEATLSEELDLETGDAAVRYDEGSNEFTVEVFVEDVTKAEFAAALNEAGVDATESDVRDGVTAQTRDEIVTTVETKVNEAGLSGARVFDSSSGSGNQHYIVVEVPDMTYEEVRGLLEDRGVVDVVAHYPGEDGEHVNEVVLTRDEMDTISPPQYNDREGYYYVAVTLEDDAAEQFEQKMVDTGFTSDPVCRYEENGSSEGHCLLTRVDGEVVDARGMNPDLGADMESGQWKNSPTYILPTQDRQEAQVLSVNLQAGALTAPLDFENDQVYSLQPALAEQFKVYSLFIGLFSVVTVSGVVYLRYTDARVAVPMILTAVSEVVILLGFAALIRMPLDLSHVAGFIAVVGTGVDDLVIIADEVLDEGDVNSRRVFESRFKKAFWVIGAAAATTIVALSPLALLSLGDLRGFAIITILGVLVGVLVTRPAYGDILRRLLTDR
ncbi:preprotein translocase subunit SecD [Salinilacihabitans rarus]|uniref:preprotein translocase subunit SecD n=1 Tax=Salinilacihabitans rarus TaxID=2961596 RepID=UPI0020C845F0|nr:preprotein translocase subunit SecD [Salinilacihabitans rarus]